MTPKSRLRQEGAYWPAQSFILNRILCHFRSHSTQLHVVEPSSLNRHVALELSEAGECQYKPETGGG